MKPRREREIKSEESGPSRTLDRLIFCPNPFRALAYTFIHGLVCHPHTALTPEPSVTVSAEAHGLPKMKKTSKGEGEGLEYSRGFISPGERKKAP